MKPGEVENWLREKHVSFQADAKGWTIYSPNGPVKLEYFIIDDEGYALFLSVDYNENIIENVSLGCYNGKNNVALGRLAKYLEMLECFSS